MASRPSRRIGLGVAGAALLAAGAACQVVLGLEEPKQGVLPAVVDPCAHAKPPGRPDAATGGAEGNYWLVMTKIEFPAKLPDAGPRGFDLDESCTCAADLRDGAAACKGFASTPTCDPTGGVDNVFAQTLLPYEDLLKLGALSDRLGNTGGRGIAMYLTNYNGESDDDDVGLTIVETKGLYSDEGCKGPRPDAALANPMDPYYVPVHDGCDHWKVDEVFLKVIDGEPKPISDIVNKGWVAGGQLVVSAGSMIVPIAGQILKANDTILTARIEPVTVDGKRVFRLVDGLAGARAPLKSFVDLVGHVQVDNDDDGGNQALCLGRLWPAVKSTLCESLDTMAVPEGDFQGVSCNAFSVAWGFTGYPIRLDLVRRTFAPEPASGLCENVVTPEQLCGSR